MAVFNFSLCFVLILYQLSIVYSDETSSESTNLGLTDSKEKEADGVRCYCNTAQCVSTGYMCMSKRGCYSDLPAHRRAHHARYGCLQHLAESEEVALSHCQNSPRSGVAPTSSDHSLLLCCFKDLCNHEDSPLARARLNITSDLDTNPVASERGTNSGEVWFKAATIAVPVCGALILFLLVAVAVKLLKADALLHTDRKLRGGYMSALSAARAEDVKKVWVGGGGAPLLVSAAGRLLPVQRAQLADTLHLQR